tara:strand:- start:187 stop:513 length:327 start_codon:yes stop_codon:yes gene_type:complete
MSLWNSMKNWIDNPAKTTQQTPAPEQPAGEGASQVVENTKIERTDYELRTISDHFDDICLQDYSLSMKIVKAHRQLFIDWYDGPPERNCIKECITEFSNKHSKFNIVD